MAELARWQWDDIGQWRDFAEQYQAEMEAAFQQQEKQIELEIPPFGTFRMDIRRMTQTTLKGRNPGYQRRIRRQAKRIPVEYFLLGEEGAVIASDSLLDKVKQPAVIEKIVEILRAIITEPEDFDHRSVNLSDDRVLGRCRYALEFLTERGFELIREGASGFLVFMGEDLSNLQGALEEARARLEQLRLEGANAGADSNEAPALSNESDDDEDEGGFSLFDLPGLDDIGEDDAAAIAAFFGVDGEHDAIPPNQIFEFNPALFQDDGRDGESPRLFSNALSNALPAQDPVDSQPEPRARGRRGAKGKKSKTKGSGKGRGRRQWRVKASRTEDQSSTADHSPPKTAGNATACSSTSPAGPPVTAAPFTLRVRLPSGKEEALELKEGTLDELVTELRTLSGFRLPLARSIPQLGRGVNPNVPLWEAARLHEGQQITVEDFEKAFMDDIQSGLIRLRDLAFVAPALDWDKQELVRLLFGRLRSLLEGSCSNWCKAAGCSAHEELRFGCALLCRLYCDKPLDLRMEVCRRLLPAEKPDMRKTKLRVDREDFMATAIKGLLELDKSSLHRPFVVEFLKEIAEDHGGPRRDFFGTFGAQLTGTTPDFWRRLPNGSLAPISDDIAQEEISQLPSSYGVKRPRELYQACGRACGLAAKYGDVIGEQFANFFATQVAQRRRSSLKELQQQLAELDATDVRSSEAFLEQDLEDAGLAGQVTLTRVRSGSCAPTDLVPGGSNIVVTDQNKAEWLELTLRDKLYDSMREAADAFRQGVIDVFGGLPDACPLLMLLSPAEFSSLLAGSAVTDDGVRRWREIAVVSEEVRQQAEWFWDVLKDGDEAFRGSVLKFATGVHRFTSAGLQTFEIQPADGGDAKLPHAMTCANMLQLPRYSTKEALESQLRKATSLCEGFQIL